jgi:hypothetical protein
VVAERQLLADKGERLRRGLTAQGPAPDESQQEFEARIDDCVSACRLYGDQMMAEELSYPDMPQYYTWHVTERRWQRRTRGTLPNPKIVSRMTTVRVEDSERYALRALLLHVRGATGFADLCHVAGTTYPTFREAALAAGLLKREDEYLRAMDQALAMGATPSQLRLLFADIIGSNDVDVVPLWSLYKDSMARDYVSQGRTDSNNEPGDLPIVTDEHRVRVLAGILTILRRTGGFCSGLRRLQEFRAANSLCRGADPAEARRLARESDPVAAAGVVQAVQEFTRHANADQRATFDTVLAAVQDYMRCRAAAGGGTAAGRGDQTCRTFFLQAAAGSGKTFVAKALLKAAQALGPACEQLACASSGVAAMLLPNGVTAHRLFGLTVPVTESSTATFKPNSERGQQLKCANLIVWDEAPMMNKEVMNAAHRTMCSVFRVDPDEAPAFAGVPVLIMGDFRQVLPVVSHGSAAAVVDATLMRSVIWPRCRVLLLTVNERVQQARRAAEAAAVAATMLAATMAGAAADHLSEADCAPAVSPTATPPTQSTAAAELARAQQQLQAAAVAEQWAEFLLQMGNGELPDRQQLAAHTDPVYALAKSFPQLRCSGSTLNDLLDDVYGTNLDDYLDATFMAARAILAPKNDHVDAVNSAMIRRLPGQPIELLATDELAPGMDATTYPLEWLHNQRGSGLPPYRLVLKPGAIVILLRNLDSSRGLCNGTRLKVKAFSSFVLQCEILTGPCFGEEALIRRTKITPTAENLPSGIQRTQFPVQLAYSLSINKAQGQTLQSVGLYLAEPCFGHGQLYVACGRVGLPSQLKILMADICDVQSADDLQTRNVVYQDVLCELYHHLRAQQQQQQQQGQQQQQQQQQQGQQLPTLPGARPSLLSPAASVVVAADVATDVAMHQVGAESASRPGAAEDWVGGEGADDVPMAAVSEEEQEQEAEEQQQQEQGQRHEEEEEQQEQQQQQQQQVGPGSQQHRTRGARRAASPSPSRRSVRARLMPAVESTTHRQQQNGVNDENQPQPQHGPQLTPRWASQPAAAALAASEATVDRGRNRGLAPPTTPGIVDGHAMQAAAASRRALLLASARPAAAPWGAAAATGVTLAGPFSAAPAPRVPLRDLAGNAPARTQDQIPAVFRESLSLHNTQHSWCFVPLINDIVGLPTSRGYYREQLCAMIGVELWNACVNAYRAQLDRTIGLTQARKLAEESRKRSSSGDYIDQGVQEQLLDCHLQEYQHLAFRLNELRLQCTRAGGDAAATTTSTRTASRFSSSGTTARQLPIFPSTIDGGGGDDDEDGDCMMDIGRGYG